MPKKGNFFHRSIHSFGEIYLETFTSNEKKNKIWHLICLVKGNKIERKQWSRCHALKWSNYQHCNWLWTYRQPGSWSVTRLTAWANAIDLRKSCIVQRAHHSIDKFTVCVCASSRIVCLFVILMEKLTWATALKLDAVHLLGHIQNNNHEKNAKFEVVTQCEINWC